MKKATLTVYIYIQNTKFVFITDKALKVTYKNDHFTRAKNLQATCSVSGFFTILIHIISLAHLLRRWEVVGATPFIS